MKSGFKPKKINTNGRFVFYLPTRYNQIIPPFGILPDVPAAHALWHYVSTAMEVYKQKKESIRMEGERNVINYHQQFLSTAQTYGVDPNEMEKYWTPVKAQMLKLGLTLPPSEVQQGKGAHE